MKRAVHNVLLLLVLISGVIVGAISTIATDLASAQTGQPQVFVAKIDDAVTPVTARYIKRAINRAEDRNAAALVFTMNTPGGLGSAMDDIIDDILKSTLPVVVYVSPVNARAASAGVFITYAANIAVMAPGTNIGSASPIMEGTTGSVTSDETLKKKVMNDAIARITNLANLRGRNADWAVTAVRDAANITADQALSLGVINLIEPDLPSLLNAIDGMNVTTASGPVTLHTAGAAVTTIDLRLFERFLLVLANPTLAYLLVSFGLIGIYLELSHPGISIPGLFGGIALILGLLGLGGLPVTWAGLGLILLSFVLFIVDLFVPSFGILTIAGLASFLIGSNILIADGSPDGLDIPRHIIWTMTGCLAATAIFLGMFVLRGQYWRKKSGKAAMIGRVGTATTALNPAGMVYVFGEYWQATTSGESVEAGSNVMVDAIDGLRMRVHPVTVGQPPDPRAVGDRRTVIPVR